MPIKLDDNLKEAITQEYDTWVASQYAGKTVAERQKLGQFYTPPVLTIKMLEKFDDLNGNILDPTCGAGGLLAATILAGADPKKCYGIELDEEIVKIARERLAKLGVPRWNIKIGDALKSESYDFDESLQDKDTLYFNIEDLGLSKVRISLELNISHKVMAQKFVLDFTSDDKEIIDNINKIYMLFEKGKNKGLAILATNACKKLKFMNALFKKYISKTFESEVVEL